MYNVFCQHFPLPKPLHTTAADGAPAGPAGHPEGSSSCPSKARVSNASSISYLQPDAPDSEVLRAAGQGSMANRGKLGVYTGAGLRPSGSVASEISAMDLSDATSYRTARSSYASAVSESGGAGAGVGAPLWQLSPMSRSYVIKVRAAVLLARVCWLRPGEWRGGRYGTGR